MAVELRTERLLLGPWRDDDLDDYAAMVRERDPRSAAAPRDGGPTVAELRARVRRLGSAPADTGFAPTSRVTADDFGDVLWRHLPLSTPR